MNKKKDTLRKMDILKKSVAFVDRQGRVSQLIGSETFIKNIELFEKSKLFKK